MPIELGHEHHYRWLSGVVVALLVLNLLDAVLTIVWLGLGKATEANPLMDTLLTLGPVPFVLGKMALVSLGSVLLWRLRHHPLAVIGIFVVFIAYYFLLLHHLRAMNLQLLQFIV